ncbi:MULTISPECIES: hypothetical protein [Bacillus]|uniref:Uncharacterized protein n=1 Tax=Bacillus cereus TaxID=1396 RepID=A0A9X6GBV4_BACCE|nr:hypothetical protein [Bacillus cereus]OOR69516.1 hypothetical protein BLX06_34555 [Bacillus cereus]
MAQWRKFVVIFIVVQEIGRAENVGGTSVGRGRRMGERGKWLCTGVRGRLCLFWWVGYGNEGLEEYEFVWI